MEHPEEGCGTRVCGLSIKTYAPATYSRHCDR